MKFLLIIFVSVAIIGSVLNYMQLPVVGINQSGKCVYIIENGVKTPCHKLPAKYVKERVAGWE